MSADETMQALVTTGGGAVALSTVERPRPGHGEALVRVRAASLNRGELRVVRGPAGVIPGWDVAGELAHDVPELGLAAGAAVAALAGGGAWAQYAVVELDALAPLPGGLSLVDAATVPTAGLTAWHALALGGDLGGRRVLITGAAGGVGRLAVQLAHAAGAHVVALARDEARAGGLRELGADAVHSDLAALEGRFDLILDGVGGDVLTGAFGLLAPGGDLVAFGGSSDAPASFDPRAMFNHAPRSRIHAYQVFESGRPTGADLGELLALVASGRLDPQVDRVLGWEDAMGALAALAAREINGKAVMEIR